MLAFGPRASLRPARSQGLPSTVERHHARRPRGVPRRRAGSRAARRSSSPATSRSREATALAEKALRRAGAAAPPPRVADPAAVARRRPGRSTSSTGRTRRRRSSRSSCPAPTRDIAGLLRALTLADAVWGGGGFGTRLNLNLREDKGYSYGVFSTLRSYCARRHLVRRRRRADQQDEGVGRRVRQGAQGDRRRQADHRGGVRRTTRDAQGARLRAAVRVARRGSTSRSPTSGSEGLPMTELQREYDETGEGDARRGAVRGREVRAAGQGVARAGRRPREDRAGTAGAQRRRDRRAGCGGQTAKK